VKKLNLNWLQGDVVSYFRHPAFFMIKNFIILFIFIGCTSKERQIQKSKFIIKSSDQICEEAFSKYSNNLNDCHFEQKNSDILGVNVFINKGAGRVFSIQLRDKEGFQFNEKDHFCIYKNIMGSLRNFHERSFCKLTISLNIE